MMFCNEEIFPVVKTDFKSYEEFLLREKPMDSEPVVLREEQYKKNCSGSVKVAHGLPNGNCNFYASVAVLRRAKYEFKIFAEFFGKSPCFRFESSGRSHLNRYNDNALPDRDIPTPHFHKVDNDGILRAYQTEELKTPEVEEKILKDFQLGANLFCQESNLCSPTKGLVVVTLHTNELDLSTHGDDPLGGATFPP